MNICSALGLAANAHPAAAIESLSMMISVYQIGISRTLPEVFPEHRAIFEARPQQNPDASEQAMRIHLRRSVQRSKKDAESEAV